MASINNGLSNVASSCFALPAASWRSHSGQTAEATSPVWLRNVSAIKKITPEKQLFRSGAWKGADARELFLEAVNAKSEEESLLSGRFLCTPQPGSPDVLRPQHLLDLINTREMLGNMLQTAIDKFSLMCWSGENALTIYGSLYSEALTSSIQGNRTNCHRLGVALSVGTEEPSAWAEMVDSEPDGNRCCHHQPIFCRLLRRRWTPWILGTEW